MHEETEQEEAKYKIRALVTLSVPTMLSGSDMTVQRDYSVEVSSTDHIDVIEEQARSGLYNEQFEHVISREEGMNIGDPGTSKLDSVVVEGYSRIEVLEV